MKQVIHDLKSGVVQVWDIPCPNLLPGSLLIKNQASVISIGTERHIIEFGNASWVGKIKNEPERVRDVLAKVKTDGLIETANAITSKLNKPIALGYASAGIVIGVGTNVDGFQVGDRVVSNGPHAEVVCVSKNLCAPIPKREEEIPFEEAAFGPIGAIALQSVRLAQPTIGEDFLVIGLGLVGLITVQLLRANGIRVLAADIDPRKLSYAKSFGAETIEINEGASLVNRAIAFSGGNGVDGVIISTSTTSSNPIREAAQASRKRGRIILSGTVGLEFKRSDFYEKELSFQVSCSLGPGRYDPEYEIKGTDYPLPFVRWTERRNIQAVLSLLSEGKLDFKSMITHRYPIERAYEAYEKMEASELALGVVLEHSPNSNDLKTKSYSFPKKVPAFASTTSTGIALIGAGNFTRRILLPAIRSGGWKPKIVASLSGVNAAALASSFGITEYTSDVDTVFGDASIGTVFIASRHDTHADFVIRALRSGKNVFVEKPLALKLEDLEKIESEYNALLSGGRSPLLTIGFNRRFSPFTVMAKKLLYEINAPIHIVMTINAGTLPKNHWLGDPVSGGGRLIGEGCHYVDLARFLVGKSFAVIDVKESSVNSFTIYLGFEDKSSATIHYFDNGPREYPKEMIQLFSGGRAISIDNFRRLRTHGFSKNIRRYSLRQKKGHREGISAFLHSVRKGLQSPIPFSEIAEVTRFTLNAKKLPPV